jgi:predicted metal-dependent phosphoesterase TrpH
MEYIFAIKQSEIYKNFYVIPGIEFGTISNNEEVHILGYFIDYNNKELLNITQKLRSSRIERANKILYKLNEMGVTIGITDVLAYSSSDNIGRPHIAKALLEKNYVKSIQEAFELYLNQGKSAYFERYHLSIDETIDLIHSVGGICILAHPGLLKDKSIIDDAIKKGIDGIECIHSKHTRIEIETYKNIAKANGLIITGGSDYHGDSDILGDFYVDIEDIPKMKERVLNV